jgi:hypothetical protein
MMCKNTMGKSMQGAMKMAYMKNRDYTLRGGKDAEIANNRQRMGEEQHSGSDAFVRAEQAKMKGMAGRAPKMDDRYMKFDACMINNGAHAQELAKDLTRGIDHLAYPVRQKVDESQD